MRKTIIMVVVVMVLGVIGAGIYRFNFTNDDIFVKKPDGTVVSYGKLENAAKAVPKRMDPSWDVNGDGINDCESDGTCDDSVDYTKPKNAGSKVEDPLLKKLMTAANITLPDIAPPMLVLLSGKETRFEGLKAGTEDLSGGAMFGDVAMLYPYYKDDTGGPDVVSTITFNFGGTGSFTYLALFAPGEASWQEVDMIRIGDDKSPQVSELKVVKDEIVVVFKDRGDVQDVLTGSQLVRRFVFENGKLVEKK